MRNLLISTMLAGAALVVAQPAQAAVTVGGFTLDSGGFGTGQGVHSTGTQDPDTTLTGIVNQEGSGVTFSSSGLISITGSGQATIAGSPSLADLNVVFEHGWDSVTFKFDNFAQTTSSFDLLVNGASLFSGGGNCSVLCVIGTGDNRFRLDGAGITSLAFTFDPAIKDAKQFRVEGVGAIPEAATWAMMVIGFGIIGGAIRRRHKVSGTYYSMV